ncbi:hypothetical protein CBL_06166 [Carabus blaptoides fortunei]
MVWWTCGTSSGSQRESAGPTLTFGNDHQMVPPYNNGRNETMDSFSNQTNESAPISFAESTERKYKKEDHGKQKVGEDQGGDDAVDAAVRCMRRNTLCVVREHRDVDPGARYRYSLAHSNVLYRTTNVTI